MSGLAGVGQGRTAEGIGLANAARVSVRELVLTDRPARLSRELRSSTSPDLGRRRTIVVLAFVASLCMKVIGLYQIGILRAMPEPDLPGLDAGRIDASSEAYGHLSTGDGFLGATSYAATAALAAMGGDDRLRRWPWLPVLLGGKALGDAVAAAKLTRDQWKDHRAFCSYCLVSAGTTAAIAVLAMPEAWRGARRLLGR